jgi:Tfp pilus assembly protein PilW
MTGDAVATAMEGAEDVTAGETTPVIPASVKATTTSTEMASPATAVESAATAAGMSTPAVPTASATSKRSPWKDGERERCGQRKNLRLGAHTDHRPHSTA